MPITGKADVTQEEIDKWFGEAKTVLLIEAPEALNDPRRIFNCDESGFPLNQKSQRGLCEVGRRQVYQKSTDRKEQITVIVCGNAAGNLIPPRILFPL